MVGNLSHKEKNHLNLYRPVQFATLIPDCESWTYREVLPCNSLHSHIICYWFFTQNETDVSEYPVLPDGCCDLVIFLKENKVSIYFVGVQSGHKIAQFSKGKAIGIRFRPCSANFLFNEPLKSCADNLIDFYSYRNSFSQKLLNIATGFTDPEITARYFDRLFLENGFFTQTSKSIRSELEPISNAVNHNESLQGLTEFYSERTLRRLFDIYLGLSPQRYHEVLRFQKALRVMKNFPEFSLSEIALTSGFYDQSHFTNRFRLFSNMTPGQMQKLIRQHTHKTSNMILKDN